MSSLVEIWALWVLSSQLISFQLLLEEIAFNYYHGEPRLLYCWYTWARLQDPWCKQCKEAPETIHHITAGGMMVAVAVIVYSNICTRFGLETLRSKGDMPLKVVQNDWVNFLEEFQAQTDKQVIDSQLDIEVVHKVEAVVTEAAVPDWRKTQTWENVWRWCMGWRYQPSPYSSEVSWLWPPRWSCSSTRHQECLSSLPRRVSARNSLI